MIRRVLISVACLVALSASVLGAFAYGASTKYPSTPWLAGLQWPVPYLTFEDCQQQAFPALRKEGLDDQYKGPRRSWYGRGPGGVAATIFCYEGPTGDVWVTIVSAHERFDPAAEMSKALLKRLNGTGNFEGQWSSRYGDLDLKQDAAGNVSGTYAGAGGCSPGKINGTVSTEDKKLVMRGTWASDDTTKCPNPYAHNGPLTFTMVTTNEIQGWWDYAGGTPGGDWWAKRK